MSVNRVARWTLVCGLGLAMTNFAWAAPKEDKAADKAAKAAGAVDKADKTVKDASTKADKAAGGAKLSGYYGIMAKEAELSEEDKAKLAPIVEARTKALADWDAQNGAKMEEANKRRAEAKAAGKKEEADKARAEYNQLRGAKQALEEEHDAKIQGALTPEQQVKWQRGGLYQGVMRKYKAAELTEDQKAKAKDLCQAAAQDIQKLPNKSKEAVTPIKDKLNKDIEAQVLTDAQRATLAQPKAKAEPKTEAKPE